jgi:hypothetical protein
MLQNVGKVNQCLDYRASINATLCKRLHYE